MPGDTTVGVRELHGDHGVVAPLVPRHGAGRQSLGGRSAPAGDGRQAAAGEERQVGPVDDHHAGHGVPVVDHGAGADVAGLARGGHRHGGPLREVRPPGATVEADDDAERGHLVGERVQHLGQEGGASEAVQLVNGGAALPVVGERGEPFGQRIEVDGGCVGALGCGCGHGVCSLCVRLPLWRCRH